MSVHIPRLDGRDIMGMESGPAFGGHWAFYGKEWVSWCGERRVRQSAWVLRQRRCVRVCVVVGGDVDVDVGEQSKNTKSWVSGTVRDIEI